jgi:Uma2 family endonuclease
VSEPHRLLTYADYAVLPDDGRWELIDGELVPMTPAPGLRHQTIVVRILRALADHLDRQGGGQVFVSPVDVVMAETVTVQPDVVYVADADAERITEPNIQGPPTLVVEVVSDRRHDLVCKVELYARFGVREYWALDPEIDQVEVFRLVQPGQPYPKPLLFVPGEQLTTDLLPGLTIDIASVLAR